MKEIVRYDHCFVCGEKNPRGLQAKFFDDNGQAVTEVVTDETFEGYRGICHGGIISTLLDEVMIKAILARGVFAVTAEMTVRFRKPVATREKLRLVGKITGIRGPVFATEGEAVGENGTIYATATGKYVQARDDLKSRLMASLDRG